MECSFYCPWFRIYLEANQSSISTAMRRKSEIVQIIFSEVQVNVGHIIRYSLYLVLLLILFSLINILLYHIFFICAWYYVLPYSVLVYWVSKSTIFNIMSQFDNELPLFCACAPKLCLHLTWFSYLWI